MEQLFPIFASGTRKNVKTIMKHITRLFYAAMALLLVVGCCNCRHKSAKNTLPLEGTSWQLIQLGGQSVKAAVDQYTVQFDASEHRMVGVGACNRLSANYTTDERRQLALSEVASTRMLCPDEAMERQFVEALTATTHYDMDGKMLLLLNNGKLLAVLQGKSE